MHLLKSFITETLFYLCSFCEHIWTSKSTVLLNIYSDKLTYFECITFIRRGQYTKLNFRNRSGTRINILGQLFDCGGTLQMLGLMPENRKDASETRA